MTEQLFSDNDLAEWKQRLKGKVMSVGPQTVRLLIARLEEEVALRELAEKVCELSIDGAPEVLKAKLAWRKRKRKHSWK